MGADGVAGADATGTDVRLLRLAGLALMAAAAAASSAAPAGQSIDVSVSRKGFEPSVLTLHRGETARLVLTSTDGEHCFAVDALRIEKRVVSGRATRLELTPERAGRFPFHCCLETGAQAERERGELIVSE